MTNDEIKNFYREIADVCLKYKMNGLVGTWFSGEGHDEMGQIQFWEPTSTQMKLIIMGISEKYLQWRGEVFKKPVNVIGRINERRSTDKGENN